MQAGLLCRGRAAMRTIHVPLWDLAGAYCFTLTWLTIMDLRGSHCSGLLVRWFRQTDSCTKSARR